MKRTTPSPSPRTRRGAARALPLLVGGVLVVGGAFLAWRALATDGTTPTPEVDVVTPLTPVQAEPEVETPADLLRPEDVPDTRPRGPFVGSIVDDATGEIIPAFVARAYPGPRPTDEEAWEEATVKRTTMSAGGWAFRFLDPGVYTLRFEAEGYAHTYFDELEYPSPLGPIEVRMSQGRWIHGRLSNARGEPAQGFPVRLVPQFSRGTSTPNEPIEGETDDEGIYSFSGVPEGRWALELSGLEGVLKEVPTSPEWAPGEAEEIVWDQTISGFTTVDLRVKFKTQRFIFAPMEAALTSTWGGRIEVPLENETARFDFVEPGVYELTVGKQQFANQPQGNPWLLEVLEIPATDEPHALFREVVPPQRERPKIDVPRQGKKNNRKGTRR